MRRECKLPEQMISPGPRWPRGYAEIVRVAQRQASSAPGAGAGGNSGLGIVLNGVGDAYRPHVTVGLVFEAVLHPGGSLADSLAARHLWPLESSA